MIAATFSDKCRSIKRCIQYTRLMASATEGSSVMGHAMLRQIGIAVNSATRQTTVPRMAQLAV